MFCMYVHDVYNPLNGITTNQAEGFKAMLKRFQNWKEAPLDIAMFSSQFFMSMRFN